MKRGLSSVNGSGSTMGDWKSSAVAYDDGCINEKRRGRREYTGAGSHVRRCAGVKIPLSSLWPGRRNTGRGESGEEGLVGPDIRCWWRRGVGSRERRSGEVGLVRWSAGTCC